MTKVASPPRPSGHPVGESSGARGSYRGATRERRRFWAGGILLGIGLGGFVDGIVLHQILQWHHMLTSTGEHPATTVAGLETNTLWDGLFHAFSWVAAVAGLLLVTRDRLWRPGSQLIGLLLVGWGLFNLVEGLVDHHILGIHHVRAGGDELAYDLGFLALGALLLAGGLTLARAGGADRLRGDGA